MRYLIRCAALTLAFASHAYAQRPASNADWEICASDDESAEARQAQIAACTRGIEAGAFSDAVLAPWHVNRAVTLAAIGEHARAISDYTEALRLMETGGSQGERSFVLGYRGDSYADLQDRARALADYSEALRLDPSNTYAQRRQQALGAR
jgi:tetratricopeptide (TPR) repeat protein